MKEATIIFVVAVVLSLPCTARATLGTVDIAFDYYGAGDSVNVWAAGYSGVGTHGGVRMLDKSGGTGQGDLWPNGPIGSFCFELSQNRSYSTLTYDVVMPEDGPIPTTTYISAGLIGYAKQEYLRELWGRFFQFTSQENSYAEAFQIAIWEIIYEDIGAPWVVTANGSPTPRGFLCTNANTTTANDWLSQLDGSGLKADLRAFVHPCKQDYLVEVPEPATICLLGFGTLSLILRRRR